MNVLLTALVLAAGFVAFVGVIVVCVIRRRRRAAFAPVLLCLALVAPVCGIAAASQSLAGVFADAAHGTTVPLMASRCRLSLSLMLLGDALGVATLLIAALLAWFDAPPKPAARPAAPAGRVGLLALFGLVAAAAVGLQHEYARATNGLVVAIVQAPTAATAEPHSADGTVAALTSRVTNGILLGTMGAPPLLVLLVGIAVASTIVAWRMELSAAWRVAAPGLLLVVAMALTLAAVFAGRPVVLP